MQQHEERYSDNVVVDLLIILYWRVFSMGNQDACDQSGHIFKNEVLAMFEDVIEIVKGE